MNGKKKINELETIDKYIKQKKHRKTKKKR